jgi:shikimate dehydrogenase
MGVMTGTTRLLGVMGDPIAHSLSPVMHNAALAEMGLDFVYVPLAVKPADLAVALEGLRAIALIGFSVTIPHKQAILPLLSEVDPLANAVGAVNTVRWTPQGWQGTNTDIFGFLSPLKALHRDWNNTSVLVLGQGGAARAVVAGCAQLGCPRIQVVGRNPDKLNQFQASWSSPEIQARLSVRPWGDLDQLLPEATLVVNTTPVGMPPQVNDSPLTSQQLALIPPGAIAYDLIYVPKPTLFLEEAKTHGLYTLDGLEMLVQQGAKALQLWTGQEVPVGRMRSALEQYLGLDRVR